MARPKNTDIKMGVDVHKRTTRVNLAVVIGVLVFLTLGVLVVVKVWRDPPQTQQEASPLR